MHLCQTHNLFYEKSYKVFATNYQKKIIKFELFIIFCVLTHKKRHGQAYQHSVAKITAKKENNAARRIKST